MFNSNELKVPETSLCLAATEYARSSCPPFLFNHVVRSYLYADWLGRRRELTYNCEVLYVAALLHDLGLTEGASARARFEIEGADAAVEFLRRYGAAGHTLELVWDAIALHTTAEVPLRKAPEIALCQLGIAFDIRGVPADAQESEFRDLVLTAYPKLDLGKGLTQALVGLYHKNPKAVSSHAVADACDRLVPGFRRANLCDVLLERRPDDSSQR